MENPLISIHVTVLKKKTISNHVLRGQDKILMIILTIVRDWDTKKYFGNGCQLYITLYIIFG